MSIKLKHKRSLGLSLFFIADKALPSRAIKILAYNRRQAKQTMQRIYKLHSDRISILVQIPIIYQD